MRPAKAFINGVVQKFGGAVISVGVRSEESSARSGRIAAARRYNSRFMHNRDNKHAPLFAPLHDWTADDVWVFLLQTKNPWGDSNRDLAALYRTATGECPLVLEAGTQSCSASRFGCWCCTLTRSNRSLEAMIDSGDEWLSPLLDIRDFLYDTTLPENKLSYRDTIGADGKVKYQNNGKVMPRGYSQKTCIEILTRLLDAQFTIRADRATPEEYRDITLISMDEIQAIRVLNRSRYNDPDWPAEVCVKFGMELPPLPEPEQVEEEAKQLQLQLAFAE